MSAILVKLSEKKRNSSKKMVKRTAILVKISEKERNSSKNWRKGAQF